MTPLPVEELGDVEQAPVQYVLGEQRQGVGGDHIQMAFPDLPREGDLTAGTGLHAIPLAGDRDAVTGDQGHAVRLLRELLRGLLSGSRRRGRGHRRHQDGGE
ncbi:hypothetical protein [Nonomuraea aurantiaca]|uniref:hypothetical protein n=1 Tax=Nonomuraea aurantiaca TaxID=2878562 RepID=UPI001CD98132|nr:hypothetical protein [Nonomuraea aurantiaca]MCA2225416.1 hypothetical protein [Nonomuraea aurantiaca]